MCAHKAIVRSFKATLRERTFNHFMVYSDVGNVINSVNTHSKHNNQKVKEMEAKNTELQVEIENLRNSFENDQKKSMEEIIQLRNVYDKEKEKAKDLEFQMAEYREEVLKLKSEKQKLSSNLKMEKEEHEALKDTTKGLVVKKEALQVDFV